MSLISRRHLSRFLGTKPSMPVPVVAPTLTQSLQDMRWPGQWFGTRAEARPGVLLYTGAVACYVWDPPVGTFPANDFIVQIPFTQGIGVEDGIITASTPPASFDTTTGFAPGVWEVWIDYALSATTPPTTRVQWTLCGSSAFGADLAPGCKAVKVQLPGMMASVARQLPQFRLVAEVPWSAVLWCQTAQVDADRGSSTISIRPIALYDSTGNVF